MDTDVLALLRRAERDLGRLLGDVEQRPLAWEEQALALTELERIAAGLVDAVRVYAEQLSRAAGQRRRPPR